MKPEITRNGKGQINPTVEERKLLMRAAKQTALAGDFIPLLAVTNLEIMLIAKKRDKLIGEIL